MSDMPPVIAISEPRPLPGVRAIRFTASSFIDDIDGLLDAAVGKALAWIAENRDHVAPVRMEFEHSDNCNRIAADKTRTPGQRLIGVIFDASWTVSVVLYYDEGDFSDT